MDDADYFWVCDECGGRFDGHSGRHRVPGARPCSGSLAMSAGFSGAQLDAMRQESEARLAALLAERNPPAAAVEQERYSTDGHWRKNG